MIYLAKLTIALFIIADMYKDGYWKRTGKLLYFTKWIMYASFIAFAFIGREFLFDWHIYAFVLLMKKPLSDISYTFGYKPKERIFIGNTHWSDKLLHKIGFVKLEQEKFPIITMIYSFLLFISIFI